MAPRTAVGVRCRRRGWCERWMLASIILLSAKKPLSPGPDSSSSLEALGCPGWPWGSRRGFPPPAGSVARAWCSDPPDHGMAGGWVTLGACGSLLAWPFLSRRGGGSASARCSRGFPGRVIGVDLFHAEVAGGFLGFVGVRYLGGSPELGAGDVVPCSAGPCAGRAGEVMMAGTAFSCLLHLLDAADIAVAARLAAETAVLAHAEASVAAFIALVTWARDALMLRSRVVAGRPLFFFSFRASPSSAFLFLVVLACFGSSVSVSPW